MVKQLDTALSFDVRITSALRENLQGLSGERAFSTSNLEPQKNMATENVIMGQTSLN